MSSSGEPTLDDLRRLLDRLQPKMVRFFARHGVSTAEAELLLTEALPRLSFRWDRVRDREQWLLAEMRKYLTANRKAISKEPRDE